MDYSKVTMAEYQAKKRKIFESLGAVKGDCKGTSLICGDCPFFIKTYTRKCGVSPCNEQYHLQEAIKLVMDYNIPVDWNKVEVDTPILVRNYEREIWHKRYFAKYKNNTVYAFDQGATSWSAENEMCRWVYAKLANIESK